MEEKNKNNTWLIIVLVLLVLGLTGYIVYDKVLLKEKTPTKKINVEATEKENSDSTQNLTQSLETRVGDIVVASDGSVYYVPNTKFLDYHYNDKELEFVDTTKIGKFSKYKVEGYNLGLVAEGGGTFPVEFEGYKLDLSNITAAYECYFGNDSWSDSILFITKGGEVDIFTVYLSISNNDKADIKLEKNVSEYKNIVSVLQSRGFGASNVILIDKNKNKYEFNYSVES